MAAGSKPTAVHFTLIFFVMLSLFLGVFAYMTHEDLSANKAELNAVRTEESKSKQAIADLQQQVQNLISVLGYDYTAVGTPDDPNSVIGATSADLRNVAAIVTPPPQQSTVRAAVASLAAILNSRSQATSQAQTSEQATAMNFQQQSAQQAQEVAAARTAQQQSEAQLRDQASRHEEQMAALRTQRDTMEQSYRDTLAQLTELTDSFNRARDDWRKVQQQLRGTIRTQKDTIAGLQAISFEASDGEVKLVDNQLRMVLINRGSLDYLNPQVTFSVYTKEHRGIARTTADVKAKIEVVSVDQRTAWCRILEDELERPIAPGDPIYSPLWQSGRTEKFAFVGIIDLDGDGVSDRELLQEIMGVNNAEIQLQILDNGQREPAEATLDVNTKFLVVGDVPNVLDVPANDERAEEIKQMMAERNRLLGGSGDGEIGEAERNGVQIISLNEFLTYVGYRNQQRVFRPGESKSFNLDSGRRKPAVDEVFNERRSGGGSTSPLFQNRRMRAGESAPGSTAP